MQAVDTLVIVGAVVLLMLATADRLLEET